MFFCSAGGDEPPALNAYSAMTEDQKQAVLNRAHHARSEQEMHDIVNSLVKSM